MLKAKINQSVDQIKIEAMYVPKGTTRTPKNKIMTQTERLKCYMAKATLNKNV